MQVHYGFIKIFCWFKKRDLSSNWWQAGDDTKKKMREDSSMTSFSENDVFLERLKSGDCHSILANCFKNIQEKIEELFIMVRKFNETHKVKAKSNWKT